jgi:P-type Ca2+ transporter type 2C
VSIITEEEGSTYSMITQFNEKNIQGLTEQQAFERLAADGYNEIPSAKQRTFLHILWEVVCEPMFLMLIACGGLYLALGDPKEALMLMCFVIVVIGITFYQEQKTERALEALRDLSSPRALVLRDGKQIRIAGREVVHDDIILLSEGDRVPADGRLLSATNLSVDESLLTGESLPVLKQSWNDRLHSEHSSIRPGGDDLPYVYSGTLVVKGQGIACVHATGPRTEIGKIGKALQVLEVETTNLQRQTGKIVRNFALIGISLCLVIVVVYGLIHSNWLEGFLAGITLAMAMLPEEFPVVLTIFLALGAWRISMKQVLTRRVPAVEMLGAATVLCVDKTGTLTLNRMKVTKIAVNGDVFDVENTPEYLPEQLHEVVEYSILASSADPFDPMEKAMKELGGHTLSDTGHIHNGWTMLREYPLSTELMSMSRVWQADGRKAYVVAAKGAPEAIACLCHFDKSHHHAMVDQIDRMANHGLRVIAVARGSYANEQLPESQHDFTYEFLGLLGLADPVRPGVPEAVRDCYTAGIRIIMITGDYPGTARNIADKIGLQPADQIITGSELDGMSDAELQERIKTACIFARAVPEQKLRIVQALKANGEVVAMTGDGVNDAPALKASHIGIAMGGRGTDVARESAALVLLDDNFASIVSAVRMGRRIFDNLKKAMAFIFSVHIPIAGMSLIPVLLDWPLALLPVHILFLELIIDPACTVVFEVENDEPDIMRHPPRKLNTPLFGRSMVFSGLIQGLGILAVVAGIYSFALRQNLGEGEARMFSFVSLVIANLGLIFANRSHSLSILQSLRTPNKALWWVSGGALFFLTLVLSFPGVRNVFQFAPMHLNEIYLIVICGLVSIFFAEIVKLKPIQRYIYNLKTKSR